MWKGIAQFQTFILSELPLCFNDLQEFTEIELVKQSDFNNIAFCFIY